MEEKKKRNIKKDTNRKSFYSWLAFFVWICAEKPASAHFSYIPFLMKKIKNGTTTAEN